MKYSSIDITNGKEQGFHLLNDFIAEAKTGCWWQGRRCPGTSFPTVGRATSRHVQWKKSCLGGLSGSFWLSTCEAQISKCLTNKGLSLVPDIAATQLTTLSWSTGCLLAGKWWHRLSWEYGKLMGHSSESKELQFLAEEVKTFCRNLFIFLRRETFWTQFPAKLKFLLEVFNDHVCECGEEILQRPVLQTITTTKWKASKTKRSWGGREKFFPVLQTFREPVTNGTMGKCPCRHEGPGPPHTQNIFWCLFAAVALPLHSKDQGTREKNVPLDISSPCGPRHKEKSSPTSSLYQLVSSSCPTWVIAIPQATQGSVQSHFWTLLPPQWGERYPKAPFLEPWCYQRGQSWQGRLYTLWRSSVLLWKKHCREWDLDHSVLNQKHLNSCPPLRLCGELRKSLLSCAQGSLWGFLASCSLFLPCQTAKRKLLVLAPCKTSTAFY